MNVQGHVPYLRRLFDAVGLGPILDELNLEIATFPDSGLARDLDDRRLRVHCQQEGWVLLTENRNHDGPTSLHATLGEFWRPGHLPVLTLANKGRFEDDVRYALTVAEDVAEILFDLARDCPRDQSRNYLPRQRST
ncbi:MAG: hypothetical protein ACRC33_12560 [Gemmataceae bacterium]